MSGKVSLIMPAYNAEAHIARSVASVLSQTYENLELIVVDDGSKDNTAKILAEIAAKDSRLKPMTVENGGPAVARNRGIAAASEDADYFMFIDSDDEYLPDAVEYAMQGAASGAELVIMGFSIVSADGSRRDYCEQEAFYGEDFGQHFARLYKANLLNQVWGKLYKASLIKENVRFEDYRWGEDRLFIFDCLEKEPKICVLPECKYLYIMQQGESLISKFYDKKFAVCLQIDERVEKLCGKYGVEDESVFRYMFAKSIFSCLTNLFTPSCKLSRKDKRAFVKNLVNNERVQCRIKAAAGGAPVKLLCAVIGSKCVCLNLLCFRMVAMAGKIAPKLFIKIKHKK